MQPRAYAAAATVAEASSAGNENKTPDREPALSLSHIYLQFSRNIRQKEGGRDEEEEGEEEGKRRGRWMSRRKQKFTGVSACTAPTAGKQAITEALQASPLLPTCMYAACVRMHEGIRGSKSSI